MIKTIESAVLITLRPGMEIPVDILYAAGDDLLSRYGSTYTISSDPFGLFPSVPRLLASFFLSGLGPFSDSAPDHWGGKVFSRNLRRTRVSESEYLSDINDLTRQGVTRFIVGDKPAAGDEGVPVLSKLPELLDTADVMEQNRGVSDVSLRRLYRATGSLGDARPRTSMSDRNALRLAKFPKLNGDDWNIIGWEVITLGITNIVGIKMPEHRVTAIKDSEERSRTVLLTRRFGRVSAPLVE